MDLSQALSEIFAVVGCCVMYHIIHQQQTIVAEFTGAGISTTVIAANECERIGRADGTSSAILGIPTKVFQVHSH